MLARFIFLAFVTFVNASPLAGARNLQKYAGEKVVNSYIIKLKDGAIAEDIASSFNTRGNLASNFKLLGNSTTIFNGFTATLGEDELNQLLISSDVEYIEENGLFHISEVNAYDLEMRAAVTQTNAPWNLARLSQDAALGAPPYTYTYSPVAGDGTDVYVIDTGIATTHTEFGGRAIWGATFGGYANVDGNGHGTHLAGIVAAITYGVAKKTRVIAVKVLSDAGSGSTADIVAGLSWVASNAGASKRPSVVLLAVGGSASTTLDNAVISVINSGIQVVVTAGGSNTDAINFSPGRVEQAITVAASTKTDTVASFSNFGSVVDLYAPGQNIISTIPTGTATFSGGSMAAAHVAGLGAYVLGLTGPIPAATLANYLVTMSVKNVLTGVPTGTPNRLASNNVTRIGITI